MNPKNHFIIQIIFVILIELNIISYFNPIIYFILYLFISFYFILFRINHPF